MKALVTGGSGLVGSAVKKLRPDWTYVDSKTYGSLTRETNVAGEYGIPIEFVGGPDGQMRKFAKPGPGEFPQPEKNLKTGLHETVEWFKNFRSQQ